MNLMIIVNSMNSLYYLSFFLMLLFPSCSKSEGQIEKIVNSMPKNIQKLDLKGEMLSIDLLHPTDFIAIDTFLLIMQHHEENIINVYSANSHKFLAKFLRRGGGPDDVNVFGRCSQWFMEDGEPKVMVQSYPTYLGVLNVRESVKANKPVFDKKYKFETPKGKELFAASHSVYLLNDEELLMTKDAVRSGVRGSNNFYFEYYNYVEDSQRPDKVQYEDFPLMEALHKSSNRILKPNRSQIAMLYSYFPILTIANIETGEIKQIHFSSSEYNVENAIKHDTRCMFWGEGEATDEYIFGLSWNGCKVAQLDEDNIYPVLYVFNWKGEPIYQYVFDRNIQMISVDDKQKYLYAVDSEDKIYRYALDDI